MYQKSLKKIGLSLVVVLAIIFSMMLTACGSSEPSTKNSEGNAEAKTTAGKVANNQDDNNKTTDNTEKTTLKIGCVMATRPSVELMQKALEGTKYNVDIVLFDGNNLPAQALAAGEIDGLFCNNERWIGTFNKEKGSNLVMPFPYYYSYGGLYSKKWNSVDEFPKGAKIVIANGITNIDGDLRLLQNAGLIKLTETPADGEYYSVIDIAENPKNIEFLPSELVTAMSAIEDVDGVVASASIVRDSGKMSPNDWLAISDRKRMSPHGLIVDEKDKDAEWVKLTQEKFETDEFYNMFNEKYDYTFILAKELDERLGKR